MTLAIVKPDHIGDLVLSSAAIRCALDRRPGSVLFVSSPNLALANALFPGTDIRALDFPHLSKLPAVHAQHPDLSTFQHVMFLRHDDRINPAWASLRCKDYSFPIDSHDHHQSMIDYGIAAVVLGGYDIDPLHFGPRLDELERKAGEVPRSIGLCIGAGFHANLWPAAHWAALGTALMARGHEVSVICGPAEAGLGTALTASLGLAPNRLIRGGADLALFLDRVGALDRIVASDGGAAHLCGLRTPLLSIFGPSPFRRYAPFGRFNRLLTRNLSCSPCCQWTAMLVNGCLSNECVTAITPSDVLNALGPPFHLPREGYVTATRPGLSLYEGVSHIAFRRKRQEREVHADSRATTVLTLEVNPNASAPERIDNGFGVPDADGITAAANRADPDRRSARRSRQRKAQTTYP